MKRQAIVWEKIFTSHISNKELVARVCKELSKPNNETSQFNKKGKRFEQKLYKNRYMYVK